MTSNVKSILLGRHRKYNVARNTARTLQRQYDANAFTTPSTVSRKIYNGLTKVIDKNNDVDIYSSYKTLKKINKVDYHILFAVFSWGVHLKMFVGKLSLVADKILQIFKN